MYEKLIVKGYGSFYFRKKCLKNGTPRSRYFSLQIKSQDLMGKNTKFYMVKN